MGLAPLAVVIPLLAAALLSALSSVLSRRLIDLSACLTTAAVGVVCVLLAIASAHQPIVYWFGGWTPLHGFPIGICFVVDPIGAGLAAFVSLCVLAAFVFSWRYFESVKSLFHAVMLVFLAATCGLCLTGDVFNLFVWFELMSAAGVTLCGYKSDETAPLQGAINFAVTNTLGAYLTLTGIALLYAHTDSLNMARIGATLAAHPPGGGVVLIAFVFCTAGFLVKAAAFPFHFWLADAHAVAPTPVCIIFSGVMVELGLYAVARLYWTIFAIPLQSQMHAVRALFLGIGLLTALVGGVQCFGQRHLKRLLAFSTISHMGVMIVGFALLDSTALAGTALYVLGHGMIKASLFICAGILLNRFQSVDEFDLQGHGRKMPWTGAVMAIGAIGLTSAPMFGNFFGEAKIDEALAHQNLGWFTAVLVLCGVLTAGAVLRVAARIFLGWGERPEKENNSDNPKIAMKRETGGASRGVPATMFAPAVLLLALSILIGFDARFQGAVSTAARTLQNTAAYQALVLHGVPFPAPGPATISIAFPSFWRELLAAGLGILLALAGLYPSCMGRLGHAPAQVASALVRPIRIIHSGKICDYVTWLIVGVTAYGATLLVLTRSL